MADNKTKNAAKDEDAVLHKIAGWPEPYRPWVSASTRSSSTACRSSVRGSGTAGPGYPKGGGPVQCFFRVDDVYLFDLTEKANISVEDGATDQLMGSAWFLTKLDKAPEERIAAIVRKAAS